MYRPVPRAEIAAALSHLRDLFRRARPLDERAQRAHERRELLVKNLLSNLPRTREHPTLASVLEIANAFALTLDGAHRLFGYRLDNMRRYDKLLNGSRTRIIEHYVYERDRMIELPSRLSAHNGAEQDIPVEHLVAEWRMPVPIRALDSADWSLPNSFYVQVGTEDSEGSPLPAGAIALVEPIGDAERSRPDPRAVYFLQLGNGYRCSRCVATGGKLLLLSPPRQYSRPQTFAYPAAVRIMGKIRFFALELPLHDARAGQTPTPQNQSASLVFPWEHDSMASLFATERRRFRRGQQDRLHAQQVLSSALLSSLTARTERRYRHRTQSQPHVTTLMHLALLNMSRYSDALRVEGLLPDDRVRFSLQTLLRAGSLEELGFAQPSIAPPKPVDQWTVLRDQYGEWPSLLSLRYPSLHTSPALESVQLTHELSIEEVDLVITKGSFVTLQKANPPAFDPEVPEKRGWHRPLYAFWKQTRLLCGHLVKDANGLFLLSRTGGNTITTPIDTETRSKLHQVIGLAVPL